MAFDVFSAAEDSESERRNDRADIRRSSPGPTVVHNDVLDRRSHSGRHDPMNRDSWNAADHGWETWKQDLQ